MGRSFFRVYFGFGQATSTGVEAEEIAETKLHRIQGSALRWPFFLLAGERCTRSPMRC
jgi:hypothetical protein